MGTDRNTNGGGLSRRQFLGLGVGAGAGLLLAACGGSKAPPGTGGQASNDLFGTGADYNGPNVKLAFWNGFTGGDGPFMRKMVQQFNSEHPNINVSMNVLQWADFYPKVPTAVQTGNGPDIAIMHIDQLATNAARRVIIPLDPVAQLLELQESDFYPQVWQAGIYKGNRYGIPLDTHPLLFYYNNKELQQGGVGSAPTDKASFEAAMKDMKAKGVQYPFWMPSAWPAHLMWFSLIHQFGGSPYNEDATQAQFNSDAGVQALTWMVDVAKQGYSPKNIAQDAQAVAFRQGKNAMTWDGIWMMNEWAKVKGLDWGAAPIPNIGGTQAVWASSHNFTITKQASTDKNKAQAAKVFIKWISDHSIDWAKSGQVPARKTVRESPEFQQLKVQSIAAKELEFVKFPPAVPGIGDITTPTFELAVNQAVLGKKDPKAALDAATQKANQLLAENRKKYGG
jgi:multiple sugar transport system substrate-binding protein